MVEVMKKGKRGKYPRPESWQTALDLCLNGARRGVDYETDARGVTKGKRINVTESVGTRGQAFASERPDEAMDCLTGTVRDLIAEGDEDGAKHWQTLADALGEWLDTPFAERDPWEPEHKKPGRKADSIKARKEPEIEAFFAAINRKSASGTRFYALSTLIYSTGSRIGETLAVELSDLDLVMGQVTFRKTKSGKPRTAAIVNLADVRAAIEAWYSVREEWNPTSDLLFVTRPGESKRTHKQGENVDYRATVKAFENVSNRAGLSSPITPHQLRHSFATQWLLAGGSLTGLSAQLGHSSPKITSGYYLHIVSDEQQRGAIALEKKRGHA